MILPFKCHCPTFFSRIFNEFIVDAHLCSNLNRGYYFSHM